MGPMAKVARLEAEGKTVKQEDKQTKGRVRSLLVLIKP